MRAGSRGEIFSRRGGRDVRVTRNANKWETTGRTGKKEHLYQLDGLRRSKAFVRGLLSHDVLETCSVDVLMEALDLAVFKPPNVANLNIEFLATGLVPAMIAALDNHRISRFQQLVDAHGPLVPFGARLQEKVLGDCVGSDPRRTFR